MGNYLFLKHKIRLEGTLKCLFSLNFQANVKGIKIKTGAQLQYVYFSN